MPRVATGSEVRVRARVRYAPRVARRGEEAKVKLRATPNPNPIPRPRVHVCIAHMRAVTFVSFSPFRPLFPLPPLILPFCLFLVEATRGSYVVLS